MFSTNVPMHFPVPSTIFNRRLIFSSCETLLLYEQMPFTIWQGPVLGTITDSNGTVLDGSPWALADITAGDGRSRTFKLRFNASSVNELPVTDPLYLAFLDQAVICMKVIMGRVPQRQEGTFEGTAEGQLQESLFLKLIALPGAPT